MTSIAKTKRGRSTINNYCRTAIVSFGSLSIVMQVASQQTSVGLVSPYITALYPTRPQPSMNILDADVGAVIYTPAVEAMGVILNDKPLLYLTGLDRSRSAVAWGPGSKLMATHERLERSQGAVQDSRQFAKVWDALTGKELLTFAGEGPASSVSWSADGNKLAISSKTEVTKIWDAKTGKELLSVGGPADLVSWSPNGKQIATASWRETCQVDTFDAATAQKALSLRFPRIENERAVGLVWSPDGRRIAEACGSTVVVWNAGTGNQEGIGSNFGSITSLAWSSDGAWLTIGGKDAVRLWNARSGAGEAQQKLRESQDTMALAWSPDGKLLATGVQVSEVGPQALVKIWDASTKDELLAFSTVISKANPNARVTSLAWSSDDKKRLAIAADGAAVIWNVSPLLVPKIRRNGTPTYESVDPISSCFDYAPRGLTIKPSREVRSAQVIAKPDGGSTFSLAERSEVEVLLKVMQPHSRMCWNGNADYDLPKGNDVLVFWPGFRSGTASDVEPQGVHCINNDPSKLNAEGSNVAGTFFVKDGSNARILRFSEMQRAADAITAAAGSTQLCVIGGRSAVDPGIKDSGRIAFWK